MYVEKLHNVTNYKLENVSTPPPQSLETAQVLNSTDLGCVCFSGECSFRGDANLGMLSWPESGTVSLLRMPDILWPKDTLTLPIGP